MDIGFPLVPMIPFFPDAREMHIGCGAVGILLIPLGLVFILGTLGIPTHPKRDQEDLRFGFTLFGIGVLSPILGAYVVIPAFILACVFAVIVITSAIIYGFKEAFLRRRN